MAKIPPPCDFGLPQQFTAWRKGQDDAVLAALESDKRFIGLVLPTGAGKSLVYMAIAKLLPARAVNLTATKALQNQLYNDYGDERGTFLVKGQSAYACRALQAGGELVNQFPGLLGPGGHPVMVDHGPCHLGVECSLKQSGCEYYDLMKEAQYANVIITNYAWWFTLHQRNDTRVQPELLVLDEAHAAPDQLANALGADVHARDVGEILNQTLHGATEWSHDEWISWASRESTRLTDMLEGTRPTTRAAAMKLRRAQWLQRSLMRVSRMDAKLLLVSDQPDAIRFDLVWAAPYAESHLFRGVKKVLLTSATLTSHTAELLGIVPNTLQMFEGQDSFPAHRRPVYILMNAPRVDHRITPEHEKLWLITIDQILRARQDRKGIIHTVSYRRRDLIMARSEYREQMMTHGRHDAAVRIEQFKRAKPGTILISPSVTTGYDFPYDECEYQIVCKVPFPDSRDPVIAARTAIDSKYPAYMAMQELQQMVGRGMRAEDDRCETLIVDAHAKWFLSKHADLATRSFRKAITRVETLPTPPPRVEQPRIRAAFSAQE